MQLDKFISEALVQILKGIESANNQQTGNKPIDDAPKPFLLKPGAAKESGTGIEFDLAVTIKSEAAGKASSKAKILSVVEAEIGGDGATSNEQVSRIKFMVYVNQWRG